MVSFDGFTLADGIPIYLQILLFLKRGAVAGTIRDGDELPSRRVLSALLGVNPNTVQKAYQLLERDGAIYSVPGKGSFLADLGDRLARKRLEAAEALKQAVRRAMESAMSSEEIRKTVELVLSGGDGQ